MTFLALDSWWWPYLFILVAGSVATDIWRFLGVYFAGNIREDAEILVFIRAIATALVAAVIAKLILFPNGALGTSPVELRITAATAGFAAFLLSGKKVYAGVGVAEAVLICGMVFIGI